jgi:hypothetical protein
VPIKLCVEQKQREKNGIRSIIHSFIVNLDYTKMCHYLYRRHRSDRTFEYVDINTDIYKMSKIDIDIDEHVQFMCSIE